MCAEKTYNTLTATFNGPVTMQIPIALNALAGLASEGGSRSGVVQPDWLQSLESQIMLRSLYEYMDNSRAVLRDLEHSLLAFQSEVDANANIGRAAEKLEFFCFEADSWGFNELFSIAQGLRRLLLNSKGRVHAAGFREAIKRGIAMLSALLNQCESDFCWRLAAADTLDCFNQAGDGVV